ncbi:uncharacterized protein N7515_003877 [Penicillium bovifimosum]|uniref:Mei2-like C-terminal RNA recognition motif domain-containing protein n=1 Tax=Penicillium bovifimosum TaxID=126998 RepID=A0A9W9H5K2_9EURO|nr:uncharacterized protein N7515_003877 [Penicillium bovifimosum]KAJ5139029.1 hypothetical protein N7515_003877 [Penicillium bovifimosum]
MCNVSPQVPLLTSNIADGVDLISDNVQSIMSPVAAPSSPSSATSRLFIIVKISVLLQDLLSFSSSSLVYLPCSFISLSFVDLVSLEIMADQSHVRSQGGASTQGSPSADVVLLDSTKASQPSRLEASADEEVFPGVDESWPDFMERYLSRWPWPTEQQAMTSPTPIPFSPGCAPVRVHHSNSSGVETLPTISEEDTVDSKGRTISLERILHGIDQRTTIMIQNIPRFLDCNQVIEVLNLTSRGAYDFLFLRRRSRLNFGYAFVNFVDPLHIIRLHLALEGKKWPGCQSAEESVKFCYAVVQGKEDLVNSCHQNSVMTRPPEEQPKVFFTSGRFAGSQAPFPRPDAARSLRGALTSTTQQGVDNNESQSQDTVAPPHTWNRSNVHHSSQMILPRASDRIARYPAAGSLPQSITADFSTTREGNPTMRPSVGRSLPGHIRFDPPLAGAERDPLPSTAQSLFQNVASASQTVAPASPSGRLAARLGYRSWGRHIRSWAQRRRAQRSSSTEKDTQSTREGK